MQPGQEVTVLGWDRSATTINPKQDPSDENYIDWVTKRGQLEAHKRDFGGSHDADLMSHIAPLLTQKRCGNDIYN